MRLAETSGGRHRRIHHKLNTGLSRLLLEHGADAIELLGTSGSRRRCTRHR